jgi:2'-5' RNA ligase
MRASQVPSTGPNCSGHSAAVQLSTEMQLPSGEPGEAQTVGQFALVAYIPDPLARFLDDLRLELTPGSKPHAHVTILPPRPLDSDLSTTLRQIAEDIKGVAPFRIELGEIEVFAASHVIYLGLSRGTREVRQLYRALNCGCLEYREPYPYHPHTTIAQNIRPEDAAGIASIARQRWAQYTGPRGFTVSVLSFVQHVTLSVWEDVAALPLGVEVPVGG